MKVAQVMSTTVDYVSPEASVKDVSRLIFGRGVNGIPVCEGKKVIGFITDKDILSKFYPSVQEFIEDPFRAGDFDAMEGKTTEVLSLKAKDIMSIAPVVVTPETPLLKAHSLMLINEIGRMPVVDEENNLIGMITKGDIFRAAIGDKLPTDTHEEYHDWLSRHYDLVVDWAERLKHEIPDLTGLFNKEKVKTILDIGCGTGEHDVALAKKGFSILGLEKSKSMHQTAVTKRAQLKGEIKNRLEFIDGDYEKMLASQKKKYDAAIFMGNAFAHLAEDYKKIFASIARALTSKNSMVVLQIINFEKVFSVKNRILEFNFAKGADNIIEEHGFLEFYNLPKKGDPMIVLNMFIFDYEGKNWRNRSKHFTKIAYLKKDDVTRILKKEGFRKISYYGGMFKGPLFQSPFKPLESDWLNIVAKR